MRMDTAFPSKYLKAADLEDKVTGQPIRVICTISTVQIEEVGNETKEDKAVLYFERKNKGLILNVGNNNELINAYGYESDDWVGSQCVVTQHQTSYMGKPIKGVLVQVLPDFVRNHRTRLTGQGKTVGGEAAVATPTVDHPVDPSAGTTQGQAQPPAAPPKSEQFVPVEEQDIPF